jgi:hypothetical protein
MKREANLDPIKLINVITDSENQLARLLHKAKKLQSIHNLLPSILPSHLCSEVTVMNLTATDLILQVNSGALAAALRLQSDHVIKSLNAEPTRLRLSGIKIKVRP